MSVLTPAPPRPRVNRAARMLTLLAYGAFALAAGLLVLLHLDPRLGGTASPMTAMLSEYAYTPGWWLWDLSLAATSAGSIALAMALRHTGVLAGRGTVVWLTLWCVTIGLVAVFTKDPQGGAVTLTGKLHLYATGVSCAALPVAGLLLARRHRAHPHWHGFARWSRRLSLGSIPFFLPFIVPFTITVLLRVRHVPTLATGLIERAMAVLELALLTVLAVWSHRAAHSRT